MGLEIGCCPPQLQIGCARALGGEVFRRLDKDKTGRLSLAELEQGLREMGFVAHDARQLLASLDLDQSGFVEYTEFLAGVMSHDRPPAGVAGGAQHERTL